MPSKRREYTQEEIDIAGRYAGLGATVKQLAYLMGEEQRTFQNHLEFYPELAAAIEVGRAHSAIKVMQTAYDMAVSGQQPAMTTFWLKTRCQWREAKEPLPDDQTKADKIKSLPTSELIRLVKEKVG
jgi:hypothetical protein